uniref:ETS-related transcription factor Elf-1-like n=1 Tax=Halichoerus grypus TaxID=9711 RepID=UPI001659BA0C|nr:ETS-related transcription factor Elf-1-like [Halichoerus grypus]XP_035947173.1 ETS-related transcription factor Elf-1-like [Halichoerus grypus]XP_035947174.1 ETS-related transcription factor Elf-1-like [Halichoerus grypus]XP_035947175.1 ETS-related transcription factor Elf-1-like [Halichoerus grypus]
MAAVVQQNDLVFEFASNVMEDEQQLGDPAIFPAVIVEHVPGADILNSYAGLACVEEPNDMITESSLDVAEEEIIDDDDDDITLTGVCASSSTLPQRGFVQFPCPVILGA